MENTAQQTPFESQLVILADVVERAQHVDGAIEFCRTCPAEWVRADLGTTFLQGLYCPLDGFALLLPYLLALLVELF